MNAKIYGVPITYNLGHMSLASGTCVFTIENFISLLKHPLFTILPKDGARITYSKGCRICRCLGKACPARWQATQIVEQNPKTRREDEEREGARGGRTRAWIRVSYWDLGFEMLIPAKLRTKVTCERGHRLGFQFGIWILGLKFRPNCV